MTNSEATSAAVALDELSPSQSLRQRFISRLHSAREYAYLQDSAHAIHGLELLFLHAIVAVLVFGWVGLVLAELGRFSLPILIAIALPITLLVTQQLRHVWRVRPVSWSPDLVAILPVLVFAVVQFTPPFEHIIGGSDPGVYVATGANIVRTGAILTVDEQLAGLSKETREVLFSSGNRLPGFYVVNADAGVVVPHGFHLYPTLLAIAYAIGGLELSLWLTPFLSILAVAGVYLLVRRLFGSVVAFVSSAFLLSNPAIAWFARFPAAEMLVMLWLFAGLLAFVLFIETGSKRLALLAGFALGAVHLTKIENIALPAALGLFFLYQWVVARWRVEFSYFVSAYAAALLHSLVQSLLVSKFYFWSHLTEVFIRPFGFSDLTMLYTSPQGQRALALVAATALAVSVVLLLGRKRIARLLDGDNPGRIFGGLLAATVIFLAAYSYYVRPPIVGEIPSLQGVPAAQANAILNKSSLTVLGWYVSPLGLFLGTAGFMVAIVRRWSVLTTVLFFVVFLESCLFLSEGRIRPLHFWAARRYVPVIFPGFAIFAAYLLWRLQTSLRGRWPESLVPAMLGLSLVAFTLTGSELFRGHVEFDGLGSRIDLLADSLPVDSIVLFDGKHSGQTLPTPMQYMWERSSIAVTDANNRDGDTRRLVSELLQAGENVFWVHAAKEELPQGKGVYLISNNTMPDVASWGFEVVRIGEWSVDVPVAIATLDQRPSLIDRLKYDLHVFRIVSKPTVVGKSDGG